MRKSLILVTLLILFIGRAYPDDDGYNLWLNYRQTASASILEQVSVPDCAFAPAIKAELKLAAEAMAGADPQFVSTGASLQFVQCDDVSLGDEGYVISNDTQAVEVRAHGDAGLLYGMYRLLREMQCGTDLSTINIRETPAYQLRIINHWDNLDGSIERGYAGKSIWKWNELPGTLSQRYTDYARACASVGINAIVLNNVNADSRILRTDYLQKVAALYNVFEAYGIRVYLSANFGAPLKPDPNGDIRKGGIGDMTTANPKDAAVVQWWKNKTDEIYTLMPHFGGFLVKANSEGMPGPQTYGCTHAEGANMFARLLKPYGGIVMWRTFVYDNSVDADRIKRSYKEFLPLDGKFDDNVVLQTKNGPLDFQPIEPPHPLIGAMKHTAVMPELQITQEYTGQSTYIVYLLPMWKEFLDFKTYSGQASDDIASLTCNASANNGFSAIAGVSNIGDDRNWTRNYFAQANWYAFARLAWNPREDGDSITDDWIACTWGTEQTLMQTIKDMMMPSWEAFAKSHTPYGMGLTMAVSDHFTADFPARAGNYWNISSNGIGTDRTVNGTNYVSQYAETNKQLFNDINTCPEQYLLSFHFAPWNHRMQSGMSLYEELMQHLGAGVELAEQNINRWKSLKEVIPSTIYRNALSTLNSELAAAKAFKASATDFFSAYATSAEDLTLTEQLISNYDFELNQSGVTNTSGIVRGIPYGWLSRGELKPNASGQKSYGINQDATNYHGNNVCWINSTPMPEQFELYQTIPAGKLTPGTYKIACKLWVEVNKKTSCRLFANRNVQYYGTASDYTNLLTPGENATYAGYAGGNASNVVLRDMEVCVDIAKGEDLTLGIKTGNKRNGSGTATDNAGWFKVDYFRIHKIKSAIPGDANDDGVVSVSDLTLVASHILGDNNIINACQADINEDGAISVSDLTAIAAIILNGN